MLAHVREHRHTLGEAPGPLANRGREEQFTHRRREHAVGREFQRPLVTHSEGANLLNGVTPELDPQRVFLGRREDVENPTAHGKLPASLDEVDPVVAHVDEMLNRLGEVGCRVDCHPHRLDIAETRSHRLQDGPNRCDDDIDRLNERIGGIWVGQSAQDRHPPTHGVGRGGEPLMRERLPAREHDDVAVGQKCAKARREILCLAAGCRGNEERHPRADGAGCGQRSSNEWLQRPGSDNGHRLCARPAGNLGNCSERRRVDDRPQESGQAHERAACARLARRSAAIIGCETTRSVTNGGIWLNAIGKPSTCEAS